MFTKANFKIIKRLDHALWDLSAKVKPDEATMELHRSYAQEILELLQSRSNYKLDRFSFAGSFGKRTNTTQSDIDCVYFINNEEPPFDRLIKEFYDICNKPEVKSSFDTFSVEMKKNSIKFKINGFEMDVVVATNFVNNLQKRGSLYRVQQREALKHIKSNPAQNCYRYSSALAEASVHFMKTRPGFANEMARIAKYWFQSLDRGFEHISGASTLIELVAVYTASKKCIYKKALNAHVKAFFKFLEFLINFEELDVSFGIFNHSLKKHLHPRVIDPVNPYNNFASYWSDNRGEINALKRSAALTLARLRNLILNFNFPGSASDEDLCEAIFRL